MSEQFQGKVLAMAAVAVFIGMDGFFSLIDREIRSAGNEPEIYAQSNPVQNIVVRVPRTASKIICIQNNMLFGDETELLNDEEAAPLMDEGFERIEWNEGLEEFSRNASNAGTRPAGPSSSSIVAKIHNTCLFRTQPA